MIDMTRAKSNRGAFRRSMVLGIAGLMSLAANASLAQQFPGDGGPAYSFDPVTGYRCVDNNCSTVYFRTPVANCICMKDNPGATRLDEVHLTCHTKEQGQWVACPVVPRYGG
jgi:hypothetical protein